MGSDILGGEVVIEYCAGDLVVLGTLVSQRLQEGRATGARRTEDNCRTGGLIAN
jgi:hypothetical protein